MSLATQNLQPPLEALVQALIDDDTRELAVPKGLEADTTQDSYGYYLGVLSRLPQIPQLSRDTSIMLWGIVLARCGGNEAGIRAAIRLSI